MIRVASRMTDDDIAPRPFPKDLQILIYLNAAIWILQAVNALRAQAVSRLANE